MTYKIVDFWYKRKVQKFKIGDWFYLDNNKTIKLKSQEVINIKLGIKPKLNTLSVIHKIDKIEGNKILFLIKDNIKVKK